MPTAPPPPPPPPPPPAPPTDSFTAGELERLIQLPFRNPGALRRWALGFVAALVPILGWLALAGYQIRVIRKSLRSEPTVLPEWDGLNDLCSDALRALPAALILSGIPNALASFAPGLLGWAFLAAPWVLVPPALVVLAGGGSVGESLDVGAHIRQIRKHSGLYVWVIGAAAALSILTALIASGAAGPGPRGWMPGSGFSPVALLLGAATMFWAHAVEAAVIGAAGRRMGIRPASQSPPDIFRR